MSVVCNTCLKMEVQACGANLRLLLKFDANINLVAYIADKFKTTYKQAVTTDSEGTVFITTVNYDPGFFNKDAGTMRLRFKTKEDDCDYLEFADPCDSEKLYKCIIIDPTEIINVNAGLLQIENSQPGDGYLEQENGGRFII